MGGYMGPLNIGAARMRLADDIHRRAVHNNRMRAEAAEQERQAKEAAKVPPHEEMQQTMVRLQNALTDLHPGDPGAVAALRSCLLDTLGVLSYCLNNVVFKESP